MLIYVAGPIDSAATAHPDLRRLVMHLRATVLGPVARDNGWVVFHPERAYSVDPARLDEVGPAIDQINRSVIIQSDVVVAILVAGVPTWGTPAEVEFALRMEQPVVILADREAASGSVQLSAWRQAGARVLHLGMSNNQQDLESQHEEVRAAVLAATTNGLRHLDPPADVVIGQLKPTDSDWPNVRDLLLPDDQIDRILRAGPGMSFGYTSDTETAMTGPQLAELAGVARTGVLLFSHADLPLEMETTEYDLHRAYPDDAGFDLTAVGDVEVPGGGRASIPLSVSVAPPPDHWGLLVARSSMWSKLGLMFIPGVIDTGWRGPLYAQVYNPGSDAVKVRHNSRVAQLILLPTWQGRAQFVQQLPAHDRGLNGFGSSGGH